MSKPELINDAIDDYAARSGNGWRSPEAAPYNSASLAEIYAPRVRQLFELHAQGFTYAEWKWDGTENRWHGVVT
jgi:hypothetical protein